MRRRFLSRKYGGVVAYNKIYYKSTDHSIVTPSISKPFNANIVANAYKDSEGIFTLDGDVIQIYSSAFYNCKSLASITIPDSVIMIGDSAFSGCTSLTSVYCKPTTPPKGNYDMFYNNASDRKIYVPTASVDAYKAAPYWRDYADCIVGYNFEDDAGGVDDSPFPMNLTTMVECGQELDEIAAYVKANGEDNSGGAGMAFKFYPSIGDMTITHSGVDYPIVEIQWDSYVGLSFLIEPSSWMFYFFVSEDMIYVYSD